MQLRTGPVFSLGDRDSDADRAELFRDLSEIETDLRRRRRLRDLWNQRAELARSGLAMPDKVRRDTLELAEFYRYFVNTGERLRQFLLAELYSRPEHQPSYHHIN